MATITPIPSFQSAAPSLNAFFTIIFIVFYSSTAIAGSDDTPVAINIDKLGNIYVVGTSYSGTTRADFTILKYNPSGSLIWERRF